MMCYGIHIAQAEHNRSRSQVLRICNGEDLINQFTCVFSSSMNKKEVRDSEISINCLI